jgi:glycosyltransferase involved in cell wall biosynthesis
MKKSFSIKLDNVNLQSSSGPNSFGQKLFKYMQSLGVMFQSHEIPDAYLCFIESQSSQFNAPMFQRLDGIYFNTDFNFNIQNRGIKKTYNLADGVIIQSEFSKNLIFKFFGEHDNYRIIHNGADTDSINSNPELELPCGGDVWCCASSWRPHKRLNENIRYFLEHKGLNDILIIGGDVKSSDQFSDPSINYIGQVPQNTLYSLYKRSKYFLHLAWLDHCPNVVVDARACGCQIICSSAGGTIEIAGKDGIIIQEEEWDFEPVELYDPPVLDFSKKIKNSYNTSFDMQFVATKYLNFIKG